MLRRIYNAQPIPHASVHEVVSSLPHAVWLSGSCTALNSEQLFALVMNMMLGPGYE